MPVIAPAPLLSPMSPYTFSQQYSETPDLAYLQLSNEEFARRNSLSLRSPPKGSIADEIISTENSNNKHYSQAKIILSNPKEMAEKYSDFASCESLSDETDNETKSLKDDGFEIQGRRHKRKKEKSSPSPAREYFLKKQNMNKSPDAVKSGSQSS